MVQVLKNKGTFLRPVFVSPAPYIIWLAKAIGGLFVGWGHHVSDSSLRNGAVFLTFYKGKHFFFTMQHL